MAKMNITRNNNKQMLNSAGNDIASANRSVRMPLAPFTNRSTRPTLATRTTRSSVGDTKYFSIMSLSTKPKKDHTFVNNFLTTICCEIAIVRKCLHDAMSWHFIQEILFLKKILLISHVLKYQKLVFWIVSEFLFSLFCYQIENMQKLFQF